ncbi:MAG: S41 family peptidase [Planctomycetales bacterium]|nr:S41 family peptidase [Planctomycetales bacterium]
MSGPAWAAPFYRDRATPLPLSATRPPSVPSLTLHPNFSRPVISFVSLNAVPARGQDASPAAPAGPAKPDESKTESDESTTSPPVPDPTAEPLDDESDYELMKLFVDTLDEVERNYVRPITRRELMEAAIQGVVGKLDEYSNYIAPTEIDRFRRDVENEFGGIGIRISTEGNHLTVVAPLEGTPAHAAGLLSGDVILSVDGKPAAGDEAIKMLRGPVGSEVTLSVQTGESAPRPVTITRASIHVETVLAHRRNNDETWNYWLEKEKKIGYVHITSFNSYTAADLRRIVTRLQGDGMRGLIIDLRDNPGGLLESAIDVCNLFISEGRIVSTRGRNVKERIWDADSEGTLNGFAIAILVNRFSASASEIVSACLQDNKRAVVIGSRTWGKGSVQRVIDVEGGRSALKITTASYHRPSGKNIHRFPGATEEDEWGVSPNEGMEVTLSRQEAGELFAYQQQLFLPADDRDSVPVFIDTQMAKAVAWLENEVHSTE